MLQELEDKIGYHFKDKKYLKTALTHSSYANENKKAGPSNERLDFWVTLFWVLLWQIICSSTVQICRKEFNQNTRITGLRKSAVRICYSNWCRKSFIIEQGEKNTGGDTRPSILADAFEAIISAIYMDGGMEQARSFILRFIEPAIQTPKPKPFKDYKTMLQEIIQQNPEEHLTYVLTGESGPDHNKHFTVEVHLNQNVIGKGGGRSKKDAEQQAAREALELMGY